MPLGICERSTRQVLRSICRNRPPLRRFYWRCLAAVHRKGIVQFPLPGYFRAPFPPIGGGCKGLFTEFGNQLPKFDPNNPAHAADLRHRQGIIPDFMPDATSIDLPENAARFLGDRTLADMKALAPGTAHSESTPTAFSNFVEKR